MVAAYMRTISLICVRHGLKNRGTDMPRLKPPLKYNLFQIICERAARRVTFTAEKEVQGEI